MRLFSILGGLTYRYRWFVLLVWGALLVGGAFFAPNLSDRLKGGFGTADSEAERVQNVMREEFGASPTTLTVIFEGDGLSAESAEFQDAQNAVLDEVRELEEVGDVISYSETNDPRFISEDDEKSYALVNFEVPSDQEQGLVDEVRGKVRTKELTTYVTGPSAVYLDIAEASVEDLRQAEKYAFPLALVILIIAFGSLAAAGVPILIGGVSVLVTLSALYFLAGVYNMSHFVLTITTMLGLGLGIDYALFAVSRFREELEHHPISEAVPRTVETAGRSIFFSGMAVLIGLTGLLFFPYMFMRSIGVAGALVVFVSVAAALTLLPAGLSILGHKVNALSIRRRRMDGTGGGFWSRSAELVMRHPILVLFVVGVVLFALLYPATHMKLGLPEASVLPKEYESRAGDDILKEDFDYARLTPMYVVATLPDDPLSAEGLAEVRELGERVERIEDVESIESIYTIGEEGAREYAERLSEAASAVPPGAGGPGLWVPELPEGISADGSVTPEGVANYLALPEVQERQEVENALNVYTAGDDKALLRAVPESSPYSAEARATVGEVRTVDPPEGVSFLVGGLSAAQKDFISGLYENVPYSVAFVLGVTYLVLFLTFRSVFIPLKAVIVNILSLTASFGAMVFVFQDGNFSGLLGFTPLGFVDATLPILMFCTIFGVSMDYEVFLLSRMREAYEHGESNTASVAKGLASTAGIITSAAAIIIVVTGAFAFTGIITTKAIGLGLAVAVFVDATIIRVLLVPATMRILGDWNWWPGGRKKSLFKRREIADVLLGARRPPRGDTVGERAWALRGEPNNLSWQSADERLRSPDERMMDMRALWAELEEQRRATAAKISMLEEEFHKERADLEERYKAELEDLKRAAEAWSKISALREEFRKEYAALEERQEAKVEDLKRTTEEQKIELERALREERGREEERRTKQERHAEEELRAVKSAAASRELELQRRLDSEIERRRAEVEELRLELEHALAAVEDGSPREVDRTQQEEDRVAHPEHQEIGFRPGRTHLDRLFRRSDHE